MLSRWTRTLRNRGRKVPSAIRTAPQPPGSTEQQSQTATPVSDSGHNSSQDENQNQDQAEDQSQEEESASEADTGPRAEAAAKSVHEKQLREKARNRWNAAIKPGHRLWNATYASFKKKLETDSIQSVLDRYFTRHERSLMAPADKQRNPALARIQRKNHARFQQLMRSPRFAAVRHKQAEFEFKLTLLWFGLPVTPIQIDFLDEFMSASDTEDDMIEAENDRRREETAQKENSLRFLNAYGKRYLGRDDLRTPDPTYEAYYALNSLYPRAAKRKAPDTQTHTVPISLRGGGISDVSLDSDIGDNDEEVDDFHTDVESPVQMGDDQEMTSPPFISLRGGGTSNLFGANSELMILDYHDPPNEKPAQDEQKQSPVKPTSSSQPGGGNVNQVSQSLMKKAEEISNSLYKPRKNSKPTVQFELDALEKEDAANAENERAKRAEIRKGKQPVRDSSVPADSPFAPKSPAQKDPFKRHDPRLQQQLTEQDRQREARETTYARPHSIHKDNPFSLHAKPIEKFLQVGSDSVPITSLGVLTPTEQRKMQVEYYHMRNILLDRSQKCPYRGCDRVIAIGEDDRMQKHLADAHQGDSCNFCDDVLYEHWSVNQRRAHFLQKHSDLFLRRIHVKHDNAFHAHARPHSRVDWERESRWSYCPRCGRNHTVLDAKADREHHDSVCYPGAPEEGTHDFCQQCGVYASKTEYHECRDNVNPEEWPYCEFCGSATGLFSDNYRAKHQETCKNHVGDNEPKYCPWCGIEQVGSLALKRYHYDNCSQAPDPAAEGPINRETNEVYPSRPPVEEQEPEENQEPPECCTLCKKNIMAFDAHLILKHIEDKHSGHTKSCIFCKLDYQKRGWTDRKAVLLHLDDHIHDRKEKIAADLVHTLGNQLPRNHPFRARPLRKDQFDAIKDRLELEETKENHNTLWESTQKLVKEMNEDKQRIAQLTKELKAAKEKLGETEKTDKPAAGVAAAPVTRPINPFASKPSVAPVISVTPAAPAGARNIFAPTPRATEQRKATASEEKTPGENKTPAVKIVRLTNTSGRAPIKHLTPSHPKAPIPPATEQKSVTATSEEQKDAENKTTAANVTNRAPIKPTTPSQQRAPPKPSRPSTGTRTAADPSYKPTGSDSDDSEMSTDDEEFRQRRLVNINKRKKLLDQISDEPKKMRNSIRDPSYRPPRVGEEDDEIDELEMEEMSRKRKTDNLIEDERKKMQNLIRDPPYRPPPEDEVPEDEVDDELETMRELEREAEEEREMEREMEEEDRRRARRVEELNRKRKTSDNLIEVERKKMRNLVRDPSYRPPPQGEEEEMDELEMEREMEMEMNRQSKRVQPARARRGAPRKMTRPSSTAHATAPKQ